METNPLASVYPPNKTVSPEINQAQMIRNAIEESIVNGYEYTWLSLSEGLFACNEYFLNKNGFSIQQTNNNVVIKW